MNSTPPVDVTPDLNGPSVSPRATSTSNSSSSGRAGRRWAARFLAVIVGVAALALVTLGGVALAGFVTPAPDRSVSVQFSDITGRVQLEFCPTLPASFDAMVKPADLSSSAALLPVWVASRDCGNPSFAQGVWLYLDRTTITVADPGQR